MKHRILPTANLLVASLPQMVHAGNYYWDTNGITAGFGAVGGITWNTSNPYWTTDSTGVATPAAYTTTTSDTIYFGTDTASYGYANAASAAVTVSGTQNVGSLYFGSQSGTTTLTGGTLNLAAESTITVNNSAATITSSITGAATSLTKAGTGTLTLAASAGADTYSGPTIITGGVLKLSGSQITTSYTTATTTSWTAPTGIGDVRYLVVGGGGGGGGASSSTDAKGAGGGGGAGGLLTGTLTSVSGSYTVTVGGGGAAGANSAAGTNGQYSAFGSFTATGGGGGGASNVSPGSGGSGGGGSGTGSTHATGGNGTTGQGNNGGNSYYSANGYPAGGGGGAGASGNTSNNPNYGGNGGDGLSSDITGTTTWYAGGGGGATGNNAGGGTGSANSGLGGKGGGGKGGARDTTYPQYYSGGNGSANTGGGGGGATRIGYGTAGAGGSGIVVLSYSYLASNVLPTTTDLSIASGSSLDLNGGVQTVASLSDYSSNNGGSVINSYAGTASTLTLNPASGTTTFSGVIGGGGGAAINLTKTGAGTQVLAGTNTSSGATAVNGGKLVVSGSIGGSAVTVSNAGTILASGSTGTIGNSVVVNNGAILAPGDAGAAGTATVNTATTFNNGAIFSWDIDAAGTGYDKLVSASLVDGGAAGGSVLRIVASDALVAQNFWNTNKTWTDILTTNGSTAIANWANIFTSISLVDSSFAPITISDGRGFSLSGNTLTWTAVPEPNTALAGILLGSGLLRRHRKHRAGTRGPTVCE